MQAEFITYVNALQLRAPDGRPLGLDADGRGSLREYLKQLVLASAQRAIDGGQDLTGHSWLSLQSGRATKLDFDAYLRATGRMKALPAFDGLALETGENQLFGNAQDDLRHFTEFSTRHSSLAGATRADALTVRQMNAMHYVGERNATVARHWRIRHGTLDRDTSLAVPVLLAAALRARGGVSVDLALPWEPAAWRRLRPGRALRLD